MTGPLYRAHTRLTLKHAAPSPSASPLEFQGYASTYALDRQGDRIAPGAFEQSLKLWRQKNRLPYLFLEHDPFEMIGLCKELREDARGLHVHARLLPEIPSTQNALALLKGGVQGLSIGFYIKSATPLGSGQGRLITEVHLQEVSLVRSPCNPEAAIHHFGWASGPPQETLDPVLQALRTLRHSFS